MTVGVYGEVGVRGGGCVEARAQRRHWRRMAGARKQPHLPARLPAGWNKPPFWTDAGEGNTTGFVAAVLDWVCDKGGLECSELAIDRLQDMIPSVSNVSRRKGV